MLCSLSCYTFVLTQSEHTQADDYLFTGGDTGDQSVQDAVVTDKRHHSLCKLGVTGNVHWSAAVKHRQRLTAAQKGQRSQETSSHLQLVIWQKLSFKAAYKLHTHTHFKNSLTCGQLGTEPLTMGYKRFTGMWGNRLDIPGRNRKFGAFREPLRQTGIFVTR